MKWWSGINYIVWRKEDLKETLIEGKWYWSHYRNINTTQERRYACDPEHKPFVRGKRNCNSLPNAWEDIYFYREKTWKARTKVKKQWQVNLPIHIDTVVYNKNIYYEEWMM